VYNTFCEKRFLVLPPVQKAYIHESVKKCMNFNLIPALKDDVQIMRVKTPKDYHLCLYISSKGKKIMPTDATVALIPLCDGTHTLKEIVEHFADVSGEPLFTIEEQLEKIIEKLINIEVIHLCERVTPVTIPQQVALLHPLEHGILEITDACNLMCVHCYNDSGQKRENELTVKEIYTVIDEMKELGVLNVTLSGGEPLMHPAFFEIVSYIRGKALGVDLFTNGTLITQSVAKTLKALNILHVTVSLDSVTPEIHDSIRGKEGAWEKTIKGINNLKTEGLPTNVAVALTQLNVKEAVLLREFLFEKGINNYKIQPVFATGRKTSLHIGVSPEEYQEVAQKVFIFEKERGMSPSLFEKERMNCGIGTYSVTIRCDGDVVPCSVFGKKAVLGNVREQSVKSIWNDSAVLNALRNMNAREHPVCSICDLLAYCKGGCIANVCLAKGAPGLHDMYSCAYVNALKSVVD
jgi:radical SAM protein with 4Fe4S-binding SPASM domain